MDNKEITEFIGRLETTGLQQVKLNLINKVYHGPHSIKKGIAEMWVKEKEQKQIEKNKDIRSINVTGDHNQINVAERVNTDSFKQSNHKTKNHFSIDLSNILSWLSHGIKHVLSLLIAKSKNL